MDIIGNWERQLQAIEIVNFCHAAAMVHVTLFLLLLRQSHFDTIMRRRSR